MKTSNKRNKKTLVNSTDRRLIEAAFNNPFGMNIVNTPEIRQAVAKHTRSIIEKLHTERKANQS
jgi:hypothetical protein